MVVILKNEVVGRILWEIKNGANYIRALDSRGISPTVLNRYIPLMEKEGLILTEIDFQTKRKILKLNESRMDEINKLIEAYLKSEKKETMEKISQAPVIFRLLTWNDKDLEEAEKLVQELEKTLEEIKKTKKT